MTSSGRGGGHRENSMETILTFDNRDLSQWSVVWSTSHIPGMDTGTGRSARMRVRGRRRLRIGSLALSALLTMHCRVSASAVTGGFFIFMMFLVASVVCLANPLRHFEVYLGQWSISGPGRAFRIIPLLDGIGIAMCIHAIVRAINCCAIAAIAAVYVRHSVADAKLPFTYCRDFNLKAYDPVMKNARLLKDLGSGYSEDRRLYEYEESSTVGLRYRAWRNASFLRNNNNIIATQSPQIGVCNETYPEQYPPLYSTPAYNFFYVEVVQIRSDQSLARFNIPLLITIIIAWLIIWIVMAMEKFVYGRLIWNNMAPWFIIIPWMWTLVLAVTAASNLTLYKTIRKVFKVGAKEVVACLTDALEVALYIHSVSVGTELIHGKGLNHYASGHIDPNLNGENVWHSAIVLLLTGLHTGGATLCALVDYIQPINSTGAYPMRESTLWILPMYSKCTSMSSYSHLVSTIVFGGLMFSYMTVAFVLLKTALHTIFEYRVKLVFVEQVVVGVLILSCMALSVLIATNGGIALLESVNSLMTGIAMPFVISLELVALMFVYRSHDFQSDMRVATEDNACASRIGIQWQIIPFITIATLIMKITVLVDAEMPQISMYGALAPLIAVVLAVPLRAAHNAHTFLRPSPRLGT